MAVSYRIDGDMAVIEFNQEDAKVNVLTADVLREFHDLVTKVQNVSGVKILLITSGKKDTFIAGADIKEIEGITVSADGEKKSRAGQDIFNLLEDLPIPTVAVIDGVALGGGCELALACRYRIATFNEKIKIGLPEVNLGVLPGFGGTYRLPRLIGISKALEIILGARALSPEEALKAGLVDHLYPQAGLWDSVLQFVKEIRDVKGRKPGLTRKKKGWPGFLDHNFVGHVFVFDQAGKSVRERAKGFYPAPLKAFELMRETFNAPRAKALAMESKAFGDLVVTDTCKNLIKVFYLTERYKKILPPECAALQPKAIKKCGVIGAGVMGGGIARILSQNGMDARLKDVSYEAVAKGLQSAAKIFEQAVKRKKLKPHAMTATMLKISGTVDYSGFQNVDCVIEAVVENMAVKKKVFEESARLVPPETLFCTNTSALSVAEMAKSLSDPSRMIGFHFFNPVHRMPLIELITTPATSAQTLCDAFNLVKRLGKTPIIVKDSPGFLVNRILLAYINEAGHLLQEGAGIPLIDKAMTDFGMPMGPFLLCDEVGLDVGLKVLRILEEGLGERFKAAPVFAQILQKGFLGKKSGQGFYKHGKIRGANPAVAPGLPQDKTALPSARECRERMIFTMVNEAARCLEDGVVDDPAAVDVGMLLGAGFPPFRAGLLRYADQCGVESIVETLNLFASRPAGARFEPCAYLNDLKSCGKGFYP